MVFCVAGDKSYYMLDILWAEGMIGLSVSVAMNPGKFVIIMMTKLMHSCVIT